jgi:hypothetical protein
MDDLTGTLGERCCGLGHGETPLGAPDSRESGASPHPKKSVNTDNSFQII